MSKQRTAVASQRIADILAERILSGMLPPGTRIKQDQLAEELETSRIPVRDALRILESRGLVTMRANAGARVTSLTVRDLEISYEIRERIEPLLLAESIPNLADSDIDEMRSVLHQLQEVTDIDQAVQLGRYFHWISYRGNTSPLLAQMVERVWDTTQSYRRAYLKLSLSQGNNTHSTEHWLLFDAVEQREVETAQAALIMHIRRTRLGLVKYGYMLAENED